MLGGGSFELLITPSDLHQVGSAATIDQAIFTLVAWARLEPTRSPGRILYLI